MLVKDILHDELLSMGEAKEILLEIRDQRTSENIELGYELRRAINHVETFAKIGTARSRQLIEELLKLEKMKPEIAYRLVDILPTNFDEIRSIYAKERFSLSEDELTSILDILSKAD